MKKFDLFTLTGLSESDLAETLLLNPRAYMALKGAVAEKHLEIYLLKLLDKGAFTSLRKGTGDFEKDFYIKIPGRKNELSIECKNVEVIKLNGRQHLTEYLRFLIKNGWINKDQLPDDSALSQLSARDVTNLLRKLPIELRESGLARYTFGKDKCKVTDTVLDDIQETIFLKNFEEYPMTIDFQRTRNSRDENDADSKSARFYRVDEIDIVGACLFSRTMQWKFLFCNSAFLPRHAKYPKCLSNRVAINDHWRKNIQEVIAKKK